MKKSFNVLGNNISRRRERLGDSIPMLAEKARVPGAHIKSLEEGKSEIDIEVISNIADALGVSVSDLTEGIPKQVIQDEIFQSEVVSVDLSYQYVIKIGKRSFRIQASRDAMPGSRDRFNTQVYTMDGVEVHDGALSNILKNIMFEVVEKLRNQKQAAECMKHKRPNGGFNASGNR